jgi:hypothetical protein
VRSRATGGGQTPTGSREITCLRTSRIVRTLLPVYRTFQRATAPCGRFVVPWSRIPKRSARAIRRPLVVYLARYAEGIEVFRRFIDSYRRFPESMEHDLLVIFKGFPDSPSKEHYYRALAGVRFLEMARRDVGYDIGSFRQACRDYVYEYYLFLGSFCRIQCAGYLTSVLACLRTARRAGVVGASGSWESGVSGQFPNYHVRTCAFIISRCVAEKVYWPWVVTKKEAFQFEHGRWGLTRQILAMGLEPYIVGSDGQWYAKDEWPLSGTYRVGEQANLMIADKQSDLYAAAGREMRSRLKVGVWGETYSSRCGADVRVPGQRGDDGLVRARK